MWSDNDAQLIDFFVDAATFMHTTSQHKYKEETTLDLFKRIGGIEDPLEFYQGFIGSPSSWHYRNKMEYWRSNW